LRPPRRSTDAANCIHSRDPANQVRTPAFHQLYKLILRARGKGTDKRPGLRRHALILRIRYRSRTIRSASLRSLTARSTNTSPTLPRTSDRSSILSSDLPRARRRRHAESTCRSSSDFASGSEPRSDRILSSVSGAVGPGHPRADRDSKPQSVSRLILKEAEIEAKPGKYGRLRRREARDFFGACSGAWRAYVPGRDSPSALPRRARSTSATFRGSSLRGYRMRWYGISCLRSAFPRRPAGCSGGSLAAMSPTRPQITTAEDWHVGFEPGPRDNPADVPRRKPDYWPQHRHYLARIDRVGESGSRPDALVQPARCVRRRRRHRLCTESMQRHQDHDRFSAKSADPVPRDRSRRCRPPVFRAFGGAGDGTHRAGERERRDAIPDLQRESIRAR